VGGDARRPLRDRQADRTHIRLANADHQRRYQLIYEYVMQRKYDEFSLRDNNCVDMVTHAAALAGINLITVFASPSAGNEDTG